MDDQPANDAVGPGARAAQFGARLDALLAEDRFGELCDLVTAAFAQRTDAGDVAEVAALVSSLPAPLLVAHAGVLLELARACEAEARVRLRARLLDRAALLPGVPLAGFGHAVEAERIIDLATDTKADEVEARCAALFPLLDAAPDAPLVSQARARASFALGRVLSWRGDPVSLARAEEMLLVAVGSSRGLGRNEWRAQALLALGYSVYYLRGEELRGRARLREAMDLLPVGHPRHAVIASFLAEAMVRSHLLPDAVPILAQLRSEATANGDQRSLGYAAWIMAMLCAERGERAATMEWLAEAERHPGDWFEHSTGSEFLAEAAICAERVGEQDAANHYLARAEQRSIADGYPEVNWYATGIINARRGDPALAIDVLTTLLAEPWFPPRDAWSAWLYLALARLRSGDEPAAALDAARGFEAATAIVGPGRVAADAGALPEVLARLEPDLTRRLGALAAAAGSTVAAALQPATPRVRLLGGLAVDIGDTAVAVPPGKPAQLLMLLAMARTAIPVDVAIDDLWPDVSGDVGRRRLRNVLARLRAACGDLVIRSGEVLALAPGTAVDVAEFQAALDALPRSSALERPALTAAALELYRDDLLPEAAYAPRVLELRDQLARRAVALLSELADGAEAAGRVDDAIAALARISEIDPYDEVVLQRGADLLARHARPDMAAVWRDRIRLLRED